MKVVKNYSSKTTFTKQIFYWTFNLLFIITLCSSLSGCAFIKWLIGEPEDVAEEVISMSDDEIIQELESWGGRPIDGHQYVIGRYFVSSYQTARDKGSITIFSPPHPQCQEYGWTQVIREWIDGEIVRDPTVLPDPDNDPGGRETSKKKITDDGFVVDGHADGSGLLYPLIDHKTFVDAPHMKSEDLQQNTQKPNARLYMMEAETCVKCLRPQSPYFACFKWYYVHKIGLGAPDSSWIISSDQASDTPSPEFNEAVTAWQQ